MFFYYKRDYSATKMLYVLNLPNFDDVLSNGVSTFTRMFYAVMYVGEAVFTRSRPSFVINVLTPIYKRRMDES